MTYSKRNNYRRGYLTSLNRSFRGFNTLRKRRYKDPNNFEEYDYPALDRYYIDKLEYAMKRKWNNHFTRPYALKRDITDILLEHIEDCIRNDRNIVCEINNKSGLGKSLIAVWLYHKINRHFLDYIPKKLKKLRKEIRDSRLRIIKLMKNVENIHSKNLIEKIKKKIEFNKKFIKEIKQVRKKGETDLTYSQNFSGSKNNFPKILPGGTNIQDENNEISGSGSRSFKTAFKNIIKAFRVKQKNYILATPDFTYVPNLHFILIPFGFKKDKPEAEWETRVLIRYIDPEKKSLRAIYLGYANLNIGSIIELLDLYDLAKMEALEQLEDSGGFESGSLTEEQKERDIGVLYNYAKENNYSGKSKQELKDWLIFDLNINADTDYTKYLVNTVYRKINEEKNKEEEAEVNNRKELLNQIYGIEEKEIFDIPIEKILDNFDYENSKWRNIERDIEIFKLMKAGKTYQKIREKLEISLSDPQLSAVKKKYDGYIAKERGELYEIYRANELRKDPEYKEWEVIRNGERGEPDIICISPDKTLLKVISCKCFELHKSSFSIKIKKFNPEIEYGLKNHNKYNKVQVFADIFDHVNKKLYRKEIKYLKPQESIKIHKEIK